MPGPLEGLRVLEVASGVSAAYAGKLLADHGADVIKVEPPEGDPARLFGPFRGDQVHPEASGRFLFLNTNKRSITLDLRTADDRALLRKLVARVDAVITDFEPWEAREHGLDYDQVDAARAGIVLASITAWGQDGPYVGYRLTDLVAQAMGGPMIWTGSPHREPLRLGGGGALALYQAGAVAALAVTMALFRQERDGVGDHLDISIYETQVASRDRSMPYLVNYIYNGTEPRRQEAGSQLGIGIRPCLDGFVGIQGGGPRLPHLLRLIGMHDLASSPTIDERIRDPEVAAEIDATYMIWLSGQTKRDAAALAQQEHLLAAPVNTIADLVEDPHFRDRGCWEVLGHPEAGPLEYPARPFVLGDSPRPPARRAPLLDEHRAEVVRLTEDAPPPRVPADRPRTLPLEGIRVADVTVVWAGPHVTQLLAEWGAEVIRIEPLTRIQPSTRGAERHTDLELEAQRGAAGIATGGSYPEYDPGPDPWNRNSGFNSHARNKLSMTCDVMTPEGREHFLRLIEQCDVLVENNVPETIERAGITYEEVRQRRPDLVMLRMPGFGLTGPYRDYRALGTHIEGLVGHHQARGYPGGTPDEGGDVFTADAAAGVQGALAVVMALRHRQRTGRGQQIELSQAENFLPFLGELVLDWQMNGREVSWGNRHRWHAPHQAYPTRGDDEWIAIDVETDEQFAALCGVLGTPDLARDPRFVTAERRKQAEAELDACIRQATTAFEKFDLFHRLQDAAVPAGPLQHAGDRCRCPQLASRSFFVDLDSPSVGTYPYPGTMWRMAQTPNRLRRGPVTLGQDNEYVYLDLLGMPRSEYDDLVAREVVGTSYPKRVLRPSE